MKIKSQATTLLLIGDCIVNGYPLELAPGQEVIINDETAEESSQLDALILAGTVIKTGQIQPNPNVTEPIIDDDEILETFVYNIQTAAVNHSIDTIDIMVGLRVVPVNHGTVSQAFGGIYVGITNTAANAPENFGIMIDNSSSNGAAADVALRISAQGMSNLGWNYGIDLHDAGIQLADIRLTHGIKIIPTAWNTLVLRSDNDTKQLTLTLTEDVPY